RLPGADTPARVRAPALGNAARGCPSGKVRRIAPLELAQYRVCVFSTLFPLRDNLLVLPPAGASLRALVLGRRLSHNSLLRTRFWGGSPCLAARSGFRHSSCFLCRHLGTARAVGAYVGRCATTLIPSGVGDTAAGDYPCNWSLRPCGGWRRASPADSAAAVADLRSGWAPGRSTAAPTAPFSPPPQGPC